jgi:hypothetical protein
MEKLLLAAVALLALAGTAHATNLNVMRWHLLAKVIYPMQKLMNRQESMPHFATPTLMGGRMQ